ncbi:MAG TPA: hypothetical protein VMX55_13800 [candidate division Zixibacteria bacterium]|nr:hypothetical protein [candidate division Zixibacteria bacterium]
MKRVFLFTVPELNYQKKDLNVPNSENRYYIGQLSRMITNAIFLSHSLRENVIIRIFVYNEVSHLIEIRSESIRYLGPEERSSASILRKVEEFVRNNFSTQIKEHPNYWFEPNPGIKLKITQNCFENLIDAKTKKIKFIQLVKKIEEKEIPNKLPLRKFEFLLLNSEKKYDIIIIHIDINQYKVTSDLLQEKINDNKNSEWDFTSLNISHNSDNSKLVGLFNLILDQN